MFGASRETWKKAIMASLFCLLMNVWFMVIERTILVPTYIVRHQMDSFIPFIPQFIVPYYLWYAYISIPMIWLFFVSPEDYIRGMVFLGTVMLAACLIYVIAPNGQRLRPHNLGDSFFERWVAFTYSVDSPNNVAPSLHVLDSMAIHATLTGCAKFRKNRIAVVVSTIVCVACSISTVFVKQHSFFDVIVAIPLGLLIWFGIYGLPRMARHHRENGNHRRFRM